MKFLLLLLLSSVMLPAVADVQPYFDSIRHDPNALYAFFKEMPKSGELHYHLDGGAYPEVMLRLAARHDYCIDPNTDVILKTKKPCIGVQIAHLNKQPDLYSHIINAWSMKNFIPGQESGHDHFFATFSKFLPIVFDFRPELLADAMKRASNQHELYLEVMVAPDNAESSFFAPIIQGKRDYLSKKQALLAHEPYQQTIKNTALKARGILQKARQDLGCETAPHQPVCSLTVKFQYYVLREQPLDHLFAQALHGFAAASADPHLFVGINLVQAEDGLISLRDYRQQMQVFKFLHHEYPTVQISLHAGELSAKDVVPGELRFHIHDAIFTGQAKRIGHGASIAYEDHAESLLKHMAKTPIPVEINLTSNQAILQLSGKTHPMHYYLAHGVPLVLSTDDEGVLRTDLTREYVKAVIDQGLDYATLKTINRNGLTFSFLPGESLWKNPQKAIPVQACESLESHSCQVFIQKNTKANLQWQLEKRFIDFEQQFHP